MTLARHFHSLADMGPVYLVGGSLRDDILKRFSRDHDFAVPGDARAFAKKVATQLGVQLIEIGKGSKALYRVISGDDILDFAPMAGKSIEEDLRKRDFTINALAYDLQSHQLIDPVGAFHDIESRTVRLVSQDAVLADPLRMVRAFRFAAALGFRIEPETLAVIARQSALIARSAGERIRAELFKMMAVEGSFHYLRQMAQAGLLTQIIPELQPCQGCLQGEIHGRDVFEHTMEAYKEMEAILVGHGALWPGFVRPVANYLQAKNRKVLLKWATLFHDLGKPQTRKVEPSGRIRFLGHEAAGGRLAGHICERLRMSGQDRSYVSLIVENHRLPLHLFDADQRGNLSSRGIVRFVRKYQDDLIGLLLHSVADQRAKVRAGPEPFSALVVFLERIFSTYFSDLKPKLAAPRLVTGHDLMRHFNLESSELIGRLLERVEEGRLNGEIQSKEEAMEQVGRWLQLEGDAGIE
ncbi:MAG: HD domain-containing protein, partial [Deltaproteobacteria bacterium]